jgi:NADPH-dependent curcumin reductase CurA
VIALKPKSCAFGFIINDHFQLMDELANQIAGWSAAGKLKSREKCR